MKQKFILNMALNLGLIFLVLSGVSAYKSGHVLFLGLSIALFVVLVYLKVVLLKHVDKDVRAQRGERPKKEKANGKQKRS